MSFTQKYIQNLSEDFDEKLTTSPTPQSSNILSNKLSSVLSSSYADSEIRDALQVLDRYQIKNTPETRRAIRLDVQKEAIERHGDIIRDFSQVAEVCSLIHLGSGIRAEKGSATQRYW